MLAIDYCEECDECDSCESGCDDCEGCEGGESCGEDGWQEDCGQCACDY